MLLLLIGLLLVAWLLTNPFYWKRRGVPSLLPIPLFGNFLSALYLSNKEYFDSIYYKFPNALYIGIHLLTKPVLILRNPQIILEILEHKAPYFASHGVYVNAKRDLFAKSVFHVEGSEWKSIRTKLSPAFSPSKVKTIMEVGKGSFEKLIGEVDSQVDKEMDAHTAALFLTVDLTATAMFGLETPIFKERTDSDFFKSAKDLTTPLSMIKMMLSLISSKVYNFFKLIIFTPETNAFILRVIDASAKASSQNAGKPNNIMDHLLEIMATDRKMFDDEFLKSQGTIMWSGGVETSANALGFTLSELANNMDIQNELRSKLGTEEGKKLLRDVIEEALRKYPIFGILTRKCTQRCVLSTGLEVEPGTLFIVPVLSIHSDPQLFPDPEKFNPGRELPKGSYLAFGGGPRACLGIRLAYAVLEEALTKLIERYEFRPGSKPTEMAPKTFFTVPKDGVRLKVRAL